MSPEQATADPNADHRSDIYAFGVLAYELLTGRPPFSGGSPQEVLAAHVTTAAAPVTQHRGTIPPALAALVMQCLEKKPADRPQSADELIPALEALLTPSGGITPHATSRSAWIPASRVGTGPWIRRGVVLATLAGAAALGYAAWRGGQPGADATAGGRVVVTWLENRTGDSTLDDIGMLAAEWIIEGLSREGFANLVPSTHVRELMTGERPGSSVAARELARRTSATFVVAGSYSLRGDSLELRAEVLDSAGSHLVARVGPVRAPRGTETGALDTLFQQVAVALDSRRAWGASSQVWPRPRNMAAWRAFQTGAMEHFVRGDWAGSITHYQRAIDFDSTWHAPYGQISAALANQGRRVAADSVLDIYNRIVPEPPPAVRATWDWLRASHRGDSEAMYRAGIRIHELDPSNTYDAAMPAARTGRYREALQIAARRDTSVWNREWRAWDNVILVSHHLLGDLDRERGHAERNIVQRGLDLRTAALLSRPLAALGRSGSVDSLFELVKDMPAGAETPAGLLNNAGWELLAHGHPEVEVRRMFQRALDYYNSLPGADRGRYATAVAIGEMMMGRLAEARSHFDSLLASAPGNIALLGQVGAVAAVQGDTATARVIDARLGALSDPYLRGAHTLWRARIAALLGDCPRAASTLRRAFDEGVTRNNYAHHQWAAFGKARQCQAVQDALRPRD